MAHSPLPWRIVRYHVPYGDWIADASGGVVCGLFSSTDENLLQSSPRLLAACELILAVLRPDDPLYPAITGAVAAAKGEPWK
jgi:hypothetical protein